MSLKKAIQDLVNYNELYQEGEVTKRLPSCREYYPLLDFEVNDLFISFWNTYQILYTQVTYSSERTKKVYKVLVGEVLSVEDVSIDQKDISRIAILAKLIVFSIEYTHKLNHRATDIAYSIVVIIKKTCNYRNDQLTVNAYY